MDYKNDTYWSNFKDSRVIERYDETGKPEYFILKVLKLEDFAMHSWLILNFKVNFFFKLYCYLGLAYAFQYNLCTLRPWLFCEGQNSHNNNEDVIYCNEVNQQFQASGSWQQD